jgi:hypothetical protein
MIFALPRFPHGFGIEPLSKNLTGVFQGVAVAKSAGISLRRQLIRSQERFRPCIENVIETIEELFCPSAE